MTNISRHGVFVQTEHPQEIKSKFDLRIQIENPPREITVPVEVVSVGIGPTFQANEQGMGLRFLEADPDVERQLRELYESALS
jgi:Tfp pilus assembly protein PilZ